MADMNYEYPMHHDRKRDRFDNSLLFFFLLLVVLFCNCDHHCDC
ncbi:hypothetical protein [Anaerosalibacter massiliensis]|uniref:Uncharacterized protein n=1 Tax=Anaerosalibacter massiliensis TaxID=1347392 RepID=A0A9X2S405_9FIRM|nr:hypothetical protein [Anaerosalibacter massiliensis]MCR2043260.1 hypothetical protein [Anaerosalibacter massiliensis]